MGRASIGAKLAAVSARPEHLYPSPHRLAAALPPPVRVKLVSLLPDRQEIRRARVRLARRFLHGDGLEIGALHLPLPMPRGTRVRYVDRMDRDALVREYPELEGHALVNVDVIDDGERLSTVPGASVDFVVANHFLEHTEDPIGTLEQHTRVLRPGGVLFLANPDPRVTFDEHRPLTTIEHLAKDHREGPEHSRDAHYEEWARLVERAPEADVPTRAAALREAGYSIHFHVWTPAVFMELVHHCAHEEGIPIELEALVPVRHEFIAVLRKTQAR
jgi:SAM-dependent methyltransferase